MARRREGSTETERAFATSVVHGGRRSGKRAHDAVVAPIVPTSTYAFRDTAEIADHFEGRAERDEYGRYGNPTVRSAEEVLAALDGAEDAALFPSGMAAITTAMLALLRAGDEVVLFADCYRRTRQFSLALGRFGVKTTLLAPEDAASLPAVLAEKKPRLVFTEAPTNPYLRVVDIATIAEQVATVRRTKLLVDATFATPKNFRPLDLGADLVIHSCTKYLAGHNDVLAGSVAGSRDLVGLIRDERSVLGGVLDPRAAYAVERGLKTLDVRVARQNETGLALASFLERHRAVARVFYPGLASHADHATAARLFTGFGGVVSFRVRGDLAATSRFVDALRLPAIAPSFGGVESLVEQPALMSFYELSTEERQAIGITNDLVRFSVGLEDPTEIIADVAAALDAAIPA